jgi:glutamate dehydrogenase (NADP+)
MAQNATRMSWSTEEVDRKLRQIMGGIHRLCLETAEGYGHPHHYALGADVASFQRVADAMIAQGI